MKVDTTVRYISLLLVLIITICVSQEVRADPVTVTDAAPFTITSAVLTGPANGRIRCGSSATFTLTLTGTGAADAVAQDLLWSVFDSDPISDDEMIGETLFQVFGDGTGTGNWEETITFTLECTSNCTLRGLAGSSGESAAKIFALIEFPFGTNAGTSNQLDIECDPVPEPATMLLLGTGLAGVAIKTRKKIKSRNREQGR